MEHLRMGQHTPWMVLVLLLSWYCTPGELFEGAGDNTPQTTPERPAPFVLTVQDGLLSLRSQEASLKAIFEAIGQRLDIEVVASIAPEECVTLAFDHLSLEEALKRFRVYARIVYLTTTSEKAPGQITKILVFPKDAATPSADPPSHATDSSKETHACPSDRHIHGRGSAGEARQPKSFRFQFDPSQAMDPRP